jgi:hypothetical protein
MPLITAAKGILTKILEGNLKAITRKQSIDSLNKKTAVAGTSYITRKLLQSEI